MREDLLPRYVRIPAGEFTMGADDGDEDERPSQSVTLRGFLASVHAVTVEQYAEFVSDTGHPVPAVRRLPLVVTPADEGAFRALAADYEWRAGVPPRARLQHPVTLVTYADATAYCAWLGRRIGQPVRLPTEAEWERAARGGLTEQRYPWGEDLDGALANFLLDPESKRHHGTRAVGSYPPNGFGLYDMAGNVWQWVSDWFRADAYGRRDTAPGPDPGRGALRLVRGGSWVSHDVRQLRCAHRHKVPPDTYAYSIGFRVVYSDAGGLA